MTNKVLNIIIAILAVFIVVYFSIRVVYWGLEINKADEDMHRTDPTSTTYYMDR